MPKRQDPKPSGFELSEAIRLFMVEYANSPETTKLWFLDQFRALREGLDATFLTDVTRESLAAFLAAEGERTYERKGGHVHKLSAQTIHHRAQAARSLFRWCVERGHIEASPAVGLKLPPLVRRQGEAFEGHEIAALLKESRRAGLWLGKRDHALVLFLLGTGARASELLGLTESSFRWGTPPDAPQVGRRPPMPTRVTLFGKGSKERVVPVGPNLYRALRDYLKVRPAIDSLALWVSFRNKPMEYGGLNMLLKNLGKYAGVGDVRPHRYRLTFTVEHYTRHKDIWALKNLLGHSKIQTTETYLRSLGFAYGTDDKYETPDTWLAEG